MILKIIYLFHVYACLPACMYLYCVCVCVPDASEGQKKALGSSGNGISDGTGIRTQALREGSDLLSHLMELLYSEAQLSCLDLMGFSSGELHSVLFVP